MYIYLEMTKFRFLPNTAKAMLRFHSRRVYEWNRRPIRRLAPEQIRIIYDRERLERGFVALSLACCSMRSDEVWTSDINPPPTVFLLHFCTNLETQLFGPKTAEFRVSAEKSHPWLCKAELKWLTLKTAFLIAIASGRRVRCIHALSVEKGHLRQNQSGATLIPSPGFLAKNESINYMSTAIFFPKMSRVSSIPQERLLCPCRALDYYVKASAKVRGVHVSCS